MIVTKELARDRRFYLELAKVVMSFPNPNMEIFHHCARNFQSALNVDAKKILGPGWNQDLRTND